VAHSSSGSPPPYLALTVDLVEALTTTLLGHLPSNPNQTSHPLVLLAETTMNNHPIGSILLMGNYFSLEMMTMNLHHYHPSILCLTTPSVRGQHFQLQMS